MWEDIDNLNLILWGTFLGISMCLAVFVIYKNRKPMASFSKTSTDRLLTCHAVLQDLMKRVVARRDCMIACGHRNEEDQNEAFDKSFSKLKFPQSKHNQSPSMAVDVVPWPEKWDDKGAFVELAIIMREEWDLMDDEDKQGFKLRWGGNWSTMGHEPNTTGFIDLPHWELIGE